MIIELIKSPFDSHSNILFSSVKKFLIGDKIYDRSNIAFPYTNIKKNYQIQITADNTNKIYVKYNGNDYLEYSGELIYSFYVLPVLGKNQIDVYDENNNLLKSYRFNCYNLHIFLAEIAKRYKGIWNKLYQAQANTYYDLNVIKDLDDDYIVPEYQYTRSVATLLGTKRYSQLTDSQYATFLHNIFDMNKYGGTLNGFYQISEAFPDYIDRIDVIPYEKYLVWNKQGTVFPDSNDLTKIKIYPNYQFLSEQDWGIINYTNEQPSSPLGICYVYVDGEKYSDGSNIGSLKVKYTDNFEFFKNEYNYVDTFSSDNIKDDTSGEITGIIDGKYLFLRRPIIGDTISVDTTGTLNVNNSVYLLEGGNNLVSLGNTYKDEIDSIAITYKSYEIPNILAKIEKDATTGQIINILETGLECYEQYYNSYLQDNYGSIVVVIRAKQKIDYELKDILNKLIRDCLPVHIRYYLVFSTISIWDYWGQEDIYFSDFDTTGIFNDIIFQDLK